MSNNISKYVQLNDFILLEYEFCKNDSNIKNISKLNSIVFDTVSGDMQYIDAASQADTNNTFGFSSIPMDESSSTWLYAKDYNTISPYISNRKNVKESNYNFDKIKIHIVSGYQFQDCDGFLMRIRANNINGGKSNISNFTWTKVNVDQFNKQLFFNTNPITLSNKRYDKYILLEIPSIYDLGCDTNKDTDGSLSNLLKISKLSDIYIDFGFIPYGMITSNEPSKYVLIENIPTTIPVTSIADNFNCFIKESSSGDYIEYYGTWMDLIIGKYINDIESGIIPLYTSNNPNDEFDFVDDMWGQITRKWILLHELEIVEHIGNNNSFITQRISITQENNFDYPNYYRPIILNSDIANAATIIYTCKLQNRMDGSQIVRKSSFNLSNPKKYGKNISRINVDNLHNFKVNNVIDKCEIEHTTTTKNVTKISKVFYDTTKVVLDIDNNVYNQGDGIVYIKDGGSVVKFNFSRIMSDDSKQNVDLSGMFTYRLRFTLTDGNYIDINTTNSRNMNTSLGQLEFELSDSITKKIFANGTSTFLIQIINPDKSYYTFYQGKYKPYSNK